MDENKDKNFLYIESFGNPLQKVSDKEIKKLITNKFGKIHDGIILEGVAAKIGELNNNNRYYTEENYLEFVEILKRKIFSKRGVYGELEHPKGYAVDTNNISHKLLDIWYNKDTKEVWIRILILNTPKGKIVKEIIDSGGTIGISARAAGSETANSDGTANAKIKMIVTYDIVYHPGFENAILEQISLNESQNFENKKRINKYTNLIVKESNFDKLSNLYESFLNTEFTDNNNFYQWLNVNHYNSLLESEQELDQQKLEASENSEDDKKEQKLSDAVDKELNESKHKRKVFEQMKLNQQYFYEYEDKAYFDNAAGFISNDLSAINN